MSDYTTSRLVKSGAQLPQFTGSPSKWKGYKRAIKEYVVISFPMAHLLHVRPIRLVNHAPADLLQEVGQVSIVNAPSSDRIPGPSPASTKASPSLGFAAATTYGLRSKVKLEEPPEKTTDVDEKKKTPDSVDQSEHTKRSMDDDSDSDDFQLLVESLEIEGAIL